MELGIETNVAQENSRRKAGEGRRELLDRAGAAPGRSGWDFTEEREELGRVAVPVYRNSRSPWV